MPGDDPSLGSTVPEETAMDTRPPIASRAARRSFSSPTLLAALAFWSAIAAPVEAFARRAGSGSVPPEIQSQLDEMCDLIERQNEVIGELREQLQRGQCVVRAYEVPSERRRKKF